MKRIMLLTAILSAVLFNSSGASADMSSGSFVITGSGYGHGVGLSQIGARAQALSGKSAEQILGYYFPGTQVLPVADSNLIRVNVGHQLTNATVALEKGFADSTFQLLSGDAVQGIPLPTDSASSLGIFNYGTSIKFSLVGKQIQAAIPKTKVRSAISVASSLFTLRWSGTESLAGPAAVVVVNGVSTSIRLHYGQLQLRAVAVTGVGYRIEISDSMRLHDEYLYGISEVSSSWPTAALQSQVIASRTYALSRMGRVRRECDCQIYNSKYDQSYIGYAKEAEPRYGKLWKAAVDQTAADPATGVAIFYQGKPINVYFFSSSGGMTQRSQDVWGTAFPYLTNVPDPWSLDPIFNPNYSHWSRTVSQEVMAAAFGLPDVIRYEVKARSVSNSVISVIGYSVTGTSKILSVGDFKVRVKLPSSWFDSPIPTDTSTPSPQPTPSS